MVPCKILWICFWPSNRSYQVPEEELYVSCAHMVHGGEGTAVTMDRVLRPEIQYKGLLWQVSNPKHSNIMSWKCKTKC